MEYCKVYMDSDADEAAMESMLNEGMRLFFDAAVVECAVFKNEIYLSDAHPDSMTYAIDRSRYYIEIGTEPDAGIGQSKFEIGISNLIVWLRERSEFVIASCDFEEFIVESTGWNWTPETPFPPGRR
ncbi:hypothetical protein [Achromobacter sp.]|uniref:hypothetical protein n=1 Tax=Achromobacter sp. TaxID=134375 RepID=UPI0028A7DEED|nr:hypothetical protein [Achromobacter sp.]